MMDTIIIPPALLPVVQAAEAAWKASGRLVVALDGMSAAGKTTAAAALAARWRAPVVHMDDFFLPGELRTAERLAEPGGNVHYERFADEVLPGLLAGAAFSYRRFDCGAMGYAGTQAVEPLPVLLVEGAYAMHPNFQKYWDVSAFLSISPEEQERRIRRRNGNDGWRSFRTRWIPMENAYHEAFATQSRADYIVEML